MYVEDKPVAGRWELVEGVAWALVGKDSRMERTSMSWDLLAEYLAHWLKIVTVKPRMWAHWSA